MIRINLLRPAAMRYFQRGASATKPFRGNQYVTAVKVK